MSSITGIILSCSLGSISDVKRQVSLGCSINEKDEYGVPAVIIAARKNNTEIVRFLLDKGVNSDVCSPNGETIIGWAKYYNNDIMKDLVCKLPDIH